MRVFMKRNILIFGIFTRIFKYTKATIDKCPIKIDRH